MPTAKDPLEEKTDAMSDEDGVIPFVSRDDASADNGGDETVPMSKYHALVSRNKEMAAQLREITTIVMSMDLPDFSNMSKKQIYAIAGGGDDVKGRLQNAEHYVRGPLWEKHKVLLGAWAKYNPKIGKAVCNRVMSKVVRRAGDVKPVLWRIRVLPMVLACYKNERNYSHRKMNEVNSGTSVPPGVHCDPCDCC